MSHNLDPPVEHNANHAARIDGEPVSLARRA